MANYVIGTDEAGYGPNLGPLVITATLWRMPEDAQPESLWEQLDGVITPEISNRKNGSGKAKTIATKSNSLPPLSIADSKKLFKQKGSLRKLELPILALLKANQNSCDEYTQFWQHLAPANARDFEDEFWWPERFPNWPIDCHADEVQSHADRLRSRFDETGIECCALRSSVIVPKRFNEAIRKFENKATALACYTLSLVESLCDEITEGSITILCDRFGGRSNYLDLVQEFLTDELVVPIHESGSRSLYRWGHKPNTKSISFEIGGEKHLPVGLASMASKYLRELSMRAFNQFWMARIPDLKPTAGYPVDAKRFCAEIESTQLQLGLEPDTIWRIR